MANALTPNLGLKKPAAGDSNWDVALNDNFDALDTEIKAQANRLAALGSGSGGGAAAGDIPFVRQAILSGRTTEAGHASFLQGYRAMSGNLCVGGTPIASSAHGSYPVSRVFDGSYAVHWHSGAAPANGQWVGYDFGTGNDQHVRVMYVTQYPPDTNYNVTSLTVQRYDAVAGWATIGTYPVPVSGVRTRIDLPATASASAWRVVAASNTGNSWWVLRELEMYGYQASDVDPYRVDLLAAEVPLRLAFAAGSTLTGARDFVEELAADVPSAWSSSNLTPSKTNYLYVERDPATGALSYGVTTIRPHYGQAPESEVYEDFPADGTIIKRGFDLEVWPLFRSATVAIASSVPVERILRAEWRGVHTWSDSQTDDNTFGYPSMTMYVNGQGVVNVSEAYSAQTEFTEEETAFALHKDWLDLNGPNTIGYYFRCPEGHGYSAHTTASQLKVRLYADPQYVTGAHWFDTNAMKLYAGSPEGWVETQRVFVGEAIADEVGLVEVRPYALLGRYESGWFPVIQLTTYTKNHNLGVPYPKVVSFVAMEPSGGGEIIDLLSNTLYYYGDGRHYGSGLKGLEGTTTIDVIAPYYPYWSRDESGGVGASTWTSAIYRIVLERSF